MPTSTPRTTLFAGTSFVAAFLAVGVAHAADYYVAPTGSDSAAGTMAAPFGTLQKGHDSASAGDTVWLRGGTYKPTKQIKLSKSGTSDTARIKFFAYAGELPIIDFSGYVSTNKAADTPALLVTGNWLHLKGFEIANVPVGASLDHSISALRSEGASNNTFEFLNIHHNFGPGLFISKGTGGNLILNVDSHDNYDKDGSQGDGQNGDGFGVHYQESGPSTIIRGCRAWLDSDDGYDLISQEVPVIIENSWAFQNGYANGGSTSPSSGNGNGFKVGSSQTGVRHIVRNNVAWKNKAAGFYANHSSGGNTWLNNTSYMNGSQYNMLASPPGDSASTIILTGDLVHRMRNNIGFPNKNTNMGGVDTMFNTWDLSITEAATDFVSTSDTGVLGPRQADGSLPDVDFLKLKAGSPLIDKGTDVMLPFVGTKPDLGADEFGAVKPPVSTGGTTGAGGTGAMAGSGSGGVPAVAGSAGSATTAGGANAGSGTGGAGPGATGGSVTGTTAGTSATGGATAGSNGNPGTNPGAGNEPTDDGTGDGGGCACSWKNTPGNSAAVAALLLLGAGLRRRKRSLAG
jgi:MYXO-CTERM domain-containing protein